MAGIREICCLVVICLATSIGGFTTIVTEAPGCLGSDGAYHPLGQTYNPEPCLFCQCEVQGETCFSVTCAPCHNPVPVPGQCCPNCEEETTTEPTTTPTTTPTSSLCDMVTCPPVPCPDAETEDCCPFCPHGAGCMDPVSGEVKAAGEQWFSSGVECFCPEGVPSDMGFQPPQCHVVTTIPPGCEVNGTIIPPGESHEPVPCKHCVCDEVSRRLFCAMPSCLIPRCPNPVRQGVCCPDCPNGPACMGMEREEVPEGQNVTYPDGTTCTCNLPEHPRDSIDLMVTCTEPKPTSCEWQGQVYPEGKFQPDPCTFCECTMGEVVCAMSGCRWPFCQIPEVPANKCCAVCPNGPDCFDDKGMIAAGKTVTYPDGKECECPIGSPEDSFNPAELICRMPTTTTTTTTTSTTPTTTTTSIPTTKRQRKRKLRRRMRQFRKKVQRLKNRFRQRLRQRQLRSP